ncbi:MAG: PAS domain-containing protein [Deltaproteobacteria bacterium]|nr:PAS domain-containing protein [Deltaproteobacteria bacterium]
MHLPVHAVQHITSLLNGALAPEPLVGALLRVLSSALGGVAVQLLGRDKLHVYVISQHGEAPEPASSASGGPPAPTAGPGCTIFPLSEEEPYAAFCIHGANEPKDLAVVEHFAALTGGPMIRTATYEAMRRELTRLEAAMACSSEGSWVWHIPSGRVSFDKRWCEMLGYNVDEVAPDLSSWERLVHPDDLADITRVLGDHLEGRTEQYQTEHRLLTKRGDFLWVLDTGMVVERDEHGQPVLAAGTHRDLTAIAKLREAYSESRNQLLSQRAAFDYGSVVVFHWRNLPGWPVEWVSRNVTTLLGYPHGAWLGGEVMYANLIHPDDFDRVLDEVAAGSVSSTNHFSHSTYRLRRADGREIWVHDDTTVLRDHKGLITHYVGYLVDVTEQVRAAEESAALQRKMLTQQRLDSLGLLAGGIAHDFNNLLVGILGNADLAVAATPEGSEILRVVQDIRIAGERAAGLVQQLLSYTGKTDSQHAPVSVNGLVSEMRQLLDVATLSAEALRLELDPADPLVMGSASHLSQIVLNLCTNAVESLASGRGTVSIRTGTAPRCLPSTGTRVLGGATLAGPLVWFEVEDDGEGMDGETIDRIFDPFFTTKPSGHGLGLSAVLGIVQAHGGQLHVRSVRGKGTVFTVYIPAYQGPVAAAPGADLLSEGALRGRTVLLVDDESLVRAVARRFLCRLGAAVLEADNGAVAVETFLDRAADISLVLMDLSMPQMDGAEAAQRMLVAVPEARIILCSGYDEHQIRSRHRSLGLAGFIQKPFTTARMSEAIRAALSL